MVSAPSTFPIKFGRFTLLQRIAHGGMAEIFLARQQGPGRFERRLVIKRILPHLAQDEKFVSMFLDEAALAAHLSHPCIAQVFDFGEEAGSYYIAMELVRGPDLRSVIAACNKTNTQVPLPIAVRLISQVISALDYAHHAVDEKGEPLHLVHRDVSPQNILVSFDGTVKLVDFGIAKAANASHQTEAGVVKGKYAYFAPEQLAHLPLDGRCDLYAAALVLYELLTLKKALGGDGPQVITAALNAQIRPIIELRPELPPRLVELMGRATRKEREERFPDGRSMAAELDALLIELNASVPAQEIAAFLSSLQGALGAPLSQLGTGSFAEDARPAPAPVPAHAGPLADTHVPEHPVPAETQVDPLAQNAQTVLKLRELAPVPAVEPAEDPSKPTDSIVELLPPRFGTGAKVALVAVLLGVSVLAWLGLRGTPSPPSKPVAVAEPAPKVQPHVAPPPAPVVVPPPVPMVATPAPVEPKPAPVEHKPVRVAHAEPAHRSVVAPEPVAAPAAPGRLSVGSSPWVEVFVDGKSLGQTPILEAPIPAGSHTVKLVNASLGITRVIPVTLAAGRLEKLAIHLQQGKLRFIVRPWADVTLDGKALGTTPIADPAVYEGTHELQLSNPKLGRKVRRSVVVKAGETTEVKVDLSRE